MSLPAPPPPPPTGWTSCIWIRCVGCQFLRACALDLATMNDSGWQVARVDSVKRWICPCCVINSPLVRYSPTYPCMQPFPEGREIGLLARVTVQLTRSLNRSRFIPSWVGPDVTDALLRQHGSPELARFHEADPGNNAGSALVLAMLMPEEFGVPGAEPLRIFGLPLPPAVMAIGKTRSRSSRGSDNRRTNFLEGLLNSWGAEVPARSQVMRAWRLFSYADKKVDVNRSFMVSDKVRLLFAVPDDAFPERETDSSRRCQGEEEGATLPMAEASA